MAEILVAADVVTIPKELIRGKSGELLRVYIDCRSVSKNPRFFRSAVQNLAMVLPSLDEYLIAGVAIGGLMFTPAVGYKTGRVHVAVRDKPKEHGLGQQIEGADVSGHQVIVVEDVCTDGRSLLAAIVALRGAGAIVERALCLVAHHPARVIKTMRDSGVTLSVLARPIDIYSALREKRIMGKEEMAIAKAWAENEASS
jgi:orotate phosphoribosyltransferase